MQHKHLFSPVRLRRMDVRTHGFHIPHQTALYALDAHDVVISRIFITRDADTSEDSPFIMNVRKEQVAL